MILCLVVLKEGSPCLLAGKLASFYTWRVWRTEAVVLISNMENNGEKAGIILLICRTIESWIKGVKRSVKFITKTVEQWENYK
jgi:hypothetical protein